MSHRILYEELRIELTPDTITSSAVVSNSIYLSNPSPSKNQQPKLKEKLKSLITQPEPSINGSQSHCAPTA